MGVISEELFVFLVSAVPILEQKFAIPYGIHQGINYWLVYLYTLVGAVLPSPFILLLIRQIFEWLKKIPMAQRIIIKIENRALKKGKNIARYEIFGLFLFVAIPLPGTGVWTGSLAAALLRLPFKQSFIAVVLGAAVCGLILLLLSIGVIAL